MAADLSFDKNLVPSDRTNSPAEDSRSACGVPRSFADLCALAFLAWGAKPSDRRNSRLRRAPEMAVFVDCRVGLSKVGGVGWGWNSF